MPEYPHRAKILTPVERDYAVWRLECEAGAGEANEDTTTLGGFKLAILDPKVWALVWCMGMAQAQGSTVNFFPSIVQTLGYNRINTMLLTAPPFVLAAMIFWIISWISDVRQLSRYSYCHLPTFVLTILASAKTPCIPSSSAASASPSLPMLFRWRLLRPVADTLP
jgi:hypothetical protein